jgi:acetylornithine deacetylase/succinyl-diaminopimelate desuccinylase-like protein
LTADLPSAEIPAFADSDEHLLELADFVAIPSISRESDPTHMRAAAEEEIGSPNLLHAPNEYIRVRPLSEGMRAWSHRWRALAGAAR